MKSDADSLTIMTLDSEGPDQPDFLHQQDQRFAETLHIPSDVDHWVRKS